MEDLGSSDEEREARRAALQGTRRSTRVAAMREMMSPPATGRDAVLLGDTDGEGGPEQGRQTREQQREARVSCVTCKRIACLLAGGEFGVF